MNKDDDDDEEETNIKKDEESEDKEKNKKKKVKSFTKWASSLSNVYLISIVQLILIEILLFLGVYFELNKVFANSLGLTLGFLIPSSFVCGFFSLFIYLYYFSKNIHKLKKCTKFSLGIYPLLMIFYFLLLTIFIESKYIFGILNLLLLDYASAVLVFMILKIKKKYGYITTTLIINVIYLVILFYIIKEASVKAIVLMSTVAFILIIYIQIFNYSHL